MIRLTEEKCARCTNKLATSNHHKDRLCGECQRELGASRGSKSLAFREWAARGKRREITRPAAVPATADPNSVMAPKDLTAFIDRQRTLVESKIADLDRQRREAEELLRILGGSAVKSDSHATG